MDPSEVFENFMKQQEIGTDEQWVDELYAAFLKRTGVAPESAALCVLRDDDTGEITYTYKSIVGFDNDNNPIFMSHVPFPLYAWEYGRRLIDRHPFGRAIALGVGAVIVMGITIVGSRRGK